MTIETIKRELEYPRSEGALHRKLGSLAPRQAMDDDALTLLQTS